MDGPVFITGGSGFIGGKLISRLVEEGYRVKALARSEASAEVVRSLGADPVSGELADRASIAEGAASCKTAFHLAARLGDWGPWEEFERVNVEGTRNVLAGCREAGVETFVRSGTEAALMAGDPLVQVDETAPLRPDSRAPYSATKAKSEKLVRDAAANGFRTVVVRPRFVWGTGDTTLLPEIVSAVENGKFAWLGGGRHYTETTHVANAVEGLILGAERGESGEAYFVTDGEPAQFRAFVTEMLRTQGIEPPNRNLPAWLATPAARISEAAWSNLPLPGDPPMTSFRAWLLTQECTIRIDKAREQLGYAPVKTREEGMAELRAS